MLGIVFLGYGKDFPGKTDRTPLPEKVQGIKSDQIEAALQYGTLMLAGLKQYLRNTLSAKDCGENLILLKYWPLTQWLVEQVSTPSQSHFLLLTSTLSSNYDIHQRWHSTLTSTLHMTIRQIAPCTAGCGTTIGVLSIAQWVSMCIPYWGSHLSTVGR